MNPVQSVKYSSVDDAVEMIQSLGKGAKLWISDIKKAFRLLPVWPGEH
jgi:acyl-CoA reductase-like NAD-dependent aldehyde dehydrogenase